MLILAILIILILLGVGPAGRQSLWIIKERISDMVDSSAVGHIDVRGLVWLAIFGLICAVILVIGGGTYGIWWLIHHVHIT